MTGRGRAASHVIVGFENALAWAGGMAEVRFGPVGRSAFLEPSANPFRRSDKLPSGAPDLDFEARSTLPGGSQKNPEVVATPCCLQQSGSHPELRFRRVRPQGAGSCDRAVPQQGLSWGNPAVHEERDPHLGGDSTGARC